VLSLHEVQSQVVGGAGWPQGTICLDTSPKEDIGAYAVLFAMDAILYLLTIIRLSKLSPRLYTQSAGSRAIARHFTSFFKLLIRDGSIYFLVVTLAAGATLGGFFYRPLLGPLTASELYLVVCSMACSRLILSLKESSRQAIYRQWELSGNPLTLPFQAAPNPDNNDSGNSRDTDIELHPRQ